MTLAGGVVGRRLVNGFAVLLGCYTASAAEPARLQAEALRCEWAVNPLGVDVPEPRLFWQLASPEPGDRQTAYQVLVASTAERLVADVGDLWDSGKVRADESLHIRYGGRALASSQAVFWKVRVWDAQRQVSAWSAPARWTMGVLRDADWASAQWIGETVTNAATTLLRREFVVQAGLVRAVAQVCGLGQYTLTANGERAGDDVISPGWTTYSKTCLYDTRDLTALLRAGTNAVGIELANGMYAVPGGRYVKFKGSFGPRKAIALLRLEYANGAVEQIGTDERWQMNRGPTTFSCVFGGEDYDARVEQPGWDFPGFATDDWDGSITARRQANGWLPTEAWQAAEVVSAPGGKLTGLSGAAPPLKIFNWLRPQNVRRITNGVAVYDFGQNAPLMLRMVVRGTAGTAVRVTPAELVKADGTVDRGSSGGRPAFWHYTLGGGYTGELFLPKYFYHGARYLQVEAVPKYYPEHGITNYPRVEDIEAGVMHSASAPVGEFACSNELFNRIHMLVRWAQRANLMSVLTDCPHRERLGWLEQYHLNGPALRYNFDLAPLYTKAMNDMADAQLPSGLVPNIAPEYVVFPPAAYDPGGAFRDSPEWGSAVVLVPWQQYQFTGDVELLRRHYDVMRRYVAYLGTRATNHIVSHGLGDWYDLGPKPPGFAQLTPVALTATAIYIEDVTVMARVAALLGHKSEARRYERLATEIQLAFNRQFFDAARATYATGSQCANAMPLVLNLCAPRHRAAVFSNLVANVQAQGLTAGDVGYRYLLLALAQGGRSDVVFAMNNQSEKPGYGYQLKRGATSLTEAWDARPQSSQNHFMLGQINEWFFGELAGIAPDPAAPGFKNVRIQPQPVGDVTWVRASYDSVRGKIRSEWRLAGDKFDLTIQIPANTTATVQLPAGAKRVISVNGLPPRQNRDVRMTSGRGRSADLQLPAGQYRIIADW